MNILFTGACGFIGFHLTKKLIREGYDFKAMIEYKNTLSKF